MVGCFLVETVAMNYVFDMSWWSTRAMTEPGSILAGEPYPYIFLPLCCILFLSFFFKLKCVVLLLLRFTGELQ